MLGAFPSASRYLRAGAGTATLGFRTEGHKYPAARRPVVAKAARTWWRTRRIRHRDAVLLSVLSASCLLADAVTRSNLAFLYDHFVKPYLNRPEILVPLLALTVLGFTTYFGGIFVLLGGLHFSWGRVGRGRFLIGLGLGVSLLGLVSRLARAILETTTIDNPLGNPLDALLAVTAGLTGVGILLGIASHTLMGRYALMVKKRAKRWWKSRKTREPSDGSFKT
jgi:hypothetical protein